MSETPKPPKSADIIDFTKHRRELEEAKEKAKALVDSPEVSDLLLKAWAREFVGKADISYTKEQRATLRFDEQPYAGRDLAEIRRIFSEAFNGPVDTTRIYQIASAYLDALDTRDN